MYIKVRVVAGAKTASILQNKPDTFTIHVRVEAKQNQANKRMMELLGTFLNVPAKSIRLISGHHQPSKIVSVEGLNNRQQQSDR